MILVGFFLVDYSEFKNNTIMKIIFTGCTVLLCISAMYLPEIHQMITSTTAILGYSMGLVVAK
jgi:hypothetical protein